MKRLCATVLLLAAWQSAAVKTGTTMAADRNNIIAMNRAFVSKNREILGGKSVRDLRGGGVFGNLAAKDKTNGGIGGFVQAICTPRVALKVITFGFLSFALPALVAPLGVSRHFLFHHTSQ